jgi:hypothetical protein
METDVVVIMASDRCAVDKKSATNVRAVIHDGSTTKSPMFPVSGCEKIRINIETCREWERIVGNRVILMSLNPDRLEGTSKYAERGENDG